jgi:hypothetical protein
MIIGESFPHSSYLLLQDYSDSITAVVNIDRGGDFAPTDVTTDYMWMGNGYDSNQPNLISLDWDESSAQIIAVRVGIPTGD